MNTKGLWATTGLIILVASVALITYVGRDDSLSGSVIEPPFAAPEFELTGSSGIPVSLADERGKVTLIFFGYTNCPDECPLAMAKLKLAVELLGRDATNTRVLLVTTDPDRDSPQALRDFVGRFNPEFVGVTGTREQLSTVWKGYGVTVMDGGESHSNYIYVIDKDGMLVETVLADAAAEDIAADIRTLLRRD